MTHKTCVARHLNILIWWPHLTWPWPRPLLIIRSILICYLLNPLGSLLAEFGLAAVISPVSVADEAKSDVFDLWPDLDLTCDLLSFFFKLHTKYSSRAFVCRLVHLATTTRFWVRQGGEIRPPPPAGRVRPNTPAGRGLTLAHSAVGTGCELWRHGQTAL